MPDWLNPKISKVIVRADFVWELPASMIPIHIANAIGPKIPGRTRQWLTDFAATKRCNFLCNEPVREGKQYTGDMRRYGIGAPDFVKQVRQWVAAEYEFLVKARFPA